MAIGTTNLPGRVNVQNEATTTLISNNNVTAGASPTLFTLSDNYLRNKISINPQTNDPQMWKKVVLAYRPSSGNQFKSLTFRRTSGTMQCSESWSSYAVSGSWLIDKVYIVNQNGTVLEFSGTDFASDTINVA